MDSLSKLIFVTLILFSLTALFAAATPLNLMFVSGTVAGHTICIFADTFFKVLAGYLLRSVLMTIVTSINLKTRCHIMAVCTPRRMILVEAEILIVLE